MQVDTAIIGAGAAGMMCAAHLGGRVLVVDHAKAPGEKIRILVDDHRIPWHEKTLGQLFCDTSAKDIIAMLRSRMADAGADLTLQSSASGFAKGPDGFTFDLQTPDRLCKVTAQNLVLATGGKSIPKMGATGFAYDIARQFGLRVTDTRAGLVPFTFAEGRFAPLAGVAAAAKVTADTATFEEALLFTHRGLSGPAVLQASSYWHEGQPISVNLNPDGDLFDLLRSQRQKSGRRNLTTELAHHLPARLVDHLSTLMDLTGNLADCSDARLNDICTQLQGWQLHPAGTEGYRTAEVTLGGVDTDDLRSATLQSRRVPNLYFIGEAVDVTGWLGGYNFQWAWSSAMAAARAING